MKAKELIRYLEVATTFGDFDIQSEKAIPTLEEVFKAMFEEQCQNRQRSDYALQLMPTIMMRQKEIKCQNYNRYENLTAHEVAQLALSQADALIAELKKLEVESR